MAEQTQWAFPTELQPKSGEVPFDLSHALNAVVALRGGNACLLASHGMVALGETLAQALRLAAEVETLASQYWHAAQLGTPHVLDRDELIKVRAKFAGYGQSRPRAKRSW